MDVTTNRHYHTNSANVKLLLRLIFGCIPCRIPSALSMKSDNNKSKNPFSFLPNSNSSFEGNLREIGELGERRLQVGISFSLDQPLVGPLQKSSIKQHKNQHNSTTMNKTTNHR